MKKASASKAAKKPKASEPKPSGAANPRQDFHCRLLCVVNCDRILKLHVRSRNAPDREEQDRKAMGVNHEFITELAKAMVDPEYKDSNGNGISLPDETTRMARGRP